MPQSIQQLLIRDTAILGSSLVLDVGSARIEVQSLMQHVLRVPRAYLLAHPERILTGPEQAGHDELLQRRLHGEPLAYILGEREFYGLTFKVTAATLIPRPETELLVDLALQRIPQTPLTAPPIIRQGGLVAMSPVIPPTGKGDPKSVRENNFRVLDLGTGCGAIALSIANARPDAEVIAVDASAAALVVARENAEYLLQSLHSGANQQGLASHIANLCLFQSDWFEKLAAQRFDLIISNPPYIAANDPHLQRGDLRFEPPSALASGDDGLNDIRRIISDAPAHLHPGGWLMLEHGFDQSVSVRRLLQQAGLNELFSVCDLAGIERVSGGQLA